MDQSTALSEHLDQLAASTGLSAGYLNEPLGALTGYLRLAVPSYLGLELVIERLGHEIVVSSFEPDVNVSDIATALWLRVEPSAGMTFYARTPGAFVDLAADREYTLRRGGATTSGAGSTSEVRLDASLVPTTVSSGMTGVAELAIINQAIGRLIDEGHDEAELEIVRQAVRAGIGTYAHAARMLQLRPGEAPGA